LFAFKVWKALEYNSFPRQYHQSGGITIKELQRDYERCWETNHIRELFVNLTREKRKGKGGVEKGAAGDERARRDTALEKNYSFMERRPRLPEVDKMEMV